MAEKRFIRYAVFLLLLLLVSGCGRKSEEDGNIKEAAGGTGSYEKAMAFMTTKYGFTEEELHDVDVEALVADYCLESEDYTKEEIREILVDMGDFYRLSPADRAFSFLGDTDKVPEGSPDLPENPDITGLALYVNPGSRQERAAFNFISHTCYAGDEGPFNLNEEQEDALKKALDDAGVPSWDHYYENDREPETTGSLRWKLVVVLKDGTVCSYGGYTRDMSGLPDNFQQLEETLLEIAGAA